MFFNRSEELMKVTVPGVMETFVVQKNPVETYFKR